MSPSPDTPSERDLELLSAYLDGELDERARTQLEQRLAQDRALRAELQRLRETVALVRSLPPVKAPRDFTLDPARYGRPVPWWSRLFDLGTVLQLSGALGTMAALAIIALAFLLSDQGAEPVSDQAPAAASPVALQASPLPSATAQPPTATLPPTPFPTPVIETFEEAESAAEAPAPEGDLAGGMAQSSPGPAEPLVALQRRAQGHALQAGGGLVDHVVVVERPEVDQLHRHPAADRLQRGRPVVAIGAAGSRHREQRPDPLAARPDQVGCHIGHGLGGSGDGHPQLVLDALAVGVGGGEGEQGVHGHPVRLSHPPSAATERDGT